MGRRSLAVQRKQEILEAFGRCVARFGLEGSSLEKIAEEAGVRRSILRHYIGNRDELIVQLAEKVVSEYQELNREFFSKLPSKNQGQALVNFLLPSKPIGTTDQLLIIEALIGASPNYSSVRKCVFEYVDDFIQLVSNQLKLIAPKSSTSKRWQVAYALVCISFNQESLQPLVLPPKYLKAARKTAKLLITALVENPK